MRIAIGRCVKHLFLTKNTPKDGIDARSSFFIVPRAVALSILFLISTSLSTFGENNDGSDDLLDQELKWLKAESVIYSVSKKEERLFETPAATYVITQEDIRRSGATTIPDLLRTVTGVNVANLDASKYAVSIRGFNDRFANKLLVLIDGRSIYTPTFSGVLWEAQHLVLEDVKRIEVIRGPGTTLWGANAVNGIINIMTKHSADSQGSFVEAGVGKEEEGFGSFRYGSTVGEMATYRIYGKFFNHDGFQAISSVSNEDDWRIGLGGFRVDLKTHGSDAFIFEGKIFNLVAGSSADQHDLDPAAIPDPVTGAFLTNRNEDLIERGGHILSRWEHIVSERSDLRLQMYYDRYERDQNISGLEENVDTIDLDFQHHLAFNDVHDVVWGAGYRHMKIVIDGGPIINVDDRKESVNQGNAFVQDTMELIPNELYFTWGSKFEYLDYSGLEIQPGMRIRWTPTENQTLWASATRAVRAPGKFDDDINIVGIRQNRTVPPGMTIPLTIRARGNKDVDSEELIAYELGYRIQPTNALSLDLATFFNDYSKLRNFQLSSFDPATLTQFFDMNNKAHGETYGMELSATWQATDNWRLTASYSLIDIQIHNDSPTAAPEFVESDEIKTPNHQAHMRSSWDLPWNIEWDLMLFFVDTIGQFNDDLTKTTVPSYFRLDVRLGWRPRDNVEINVVGQNLLDNRHPEFVIVPPRLNPAEVERTVYAAIKWYF